MKKILAGLILMMLLAGLAGCGPDSTQPPVQTTVQPAKNVTPKAEDASNFIGEQKAWDIALERAGINADDVIFNRIDLERDNGIWKYEIEFRKENTEYDIDVKADDGTIISYETEVD